MYVDDAPAGKMALEGARYFRFDLCPSDIRNGGKLSMQVIHSYFLL
jgi:hypothetical protein